MKDIEISWAYRWQPQTCEYEPVSVQPLTEEKTKMKNIAISVYVLSDGNRTNAEAQLEADDLTVLAVGNGSSSREPGDKADPLIGENLAVARALSSLAKKMERRANGRMRHAEAVKAHREQIKLKNQDSPEKRSISQEVPTSQVYRAYLKNLAKVFDV